MSLKKLIKPLLFTRGMKSITRLTLDRELDKQFSRLKPGLVLDIGSKLSPYRSKIASTKYLRLDIDPDSNPDICSDIHNINWESDYFDTVILTETLEHLYDPGKAMREIYRVMKPGGVCIASTRFVYPYHPDPHDYFRFTWDSLQFVFGQFSVVEVHTHGNKLQTLWQLINVGRLRLILNVFNPILDLFSSKTTTCPLGFVVHATK